MKAFGLISLWFTSLLHWHVLYNGSTESQEFYYGEVSQCKILLTNALETKLIMGKEGRCQSIMVLTSITTSLCHHQSRKKLFTLLAFFFFLFFWLVCNVDQCLLHVYEFEYGLRFLSTQLPQAVGVAYSLKMDKKDACVVTFLGDGGSSEVTAQTFFF